MQAGTLNSKGLNPHHEILTHWWLLRLPIGAPMTCGYLASGPCPWGGDHSFLFSLYSQASGGE